MTALEEEHGQGRAKSYHHGDLRNALIAATLLLVEEKGVDGFTMSEAARRAGVSVAAPYRHFADRTALVTATSAHGFDALYDALTVDVDDAMHDPIAVVIETAARYVEFAEESPARFALMFSSGIDKAASPELSSAVNRPRVVLEDMVRDLTSRGVHAGEDATALWSIAHGVATLASNGLLVDYLENGSSAAHAARKLVRTWLTGLSVQGEVGSSVIVESTVPTSLSSGETTISSSGPRLQRRT